VRLRRILLLALLVVALVAFVPFGTVVAVKVVRAALGKRAVFRDVRAEVARQLGELRPDLTDAQRDAAARIVAAQAVLETGGDAPAWREGFNFGNVRKGSWTGPLTYAGDKAPDVNDRDGDGDRAELVSETGVAFRRYDSLRSAVADFLTLLGWPRYRPARDALFRGDAAGYVARLRDDDPATAAIEGGYFTAPLVEYQRGVAAALRSYA
jgi:flagellum-specific peptidoglycan hydrolase FlgJ